MRPRSPASAAASTSGPTRGWWLLEAQEASKTPQDASKIRQDGAKMGQDASKRAQEASKTGQEASKSAQDPPRRPKIFQKWKQVAPKSIEKSALS